MKKTIIIIVVLLVIALGGYVIWQQSQPVVDQGTGTLQSADQTNANPPATITGNVTTDLTNLEQENQADNFNSIDTDFGAEINAATKN